MHVRHHGGHPAHVEILAARAVRAGHQLVDVALHRGFPEAHVGHIDGEFLGVLGHLGRGLGEHEAAHFPIQGEHHHALAQGQHQQRGRAVEHVARRYLIATGLEEGRLIGLGALGAAQHREDGANGNIHVDVGGAIEGIEQQQVFALGVAMGDGVRMLHFLRGHGGEVAAPLIGFEEDFVGDHVQLFLHLALDVVGAGGPQHIGQGALAHGNGDGLAGAGNDFDQETQVGGDVLVALGLDQVARKGDF